MEPNFAMMVFVRYCRVIELLVRCNADALLTIYGAGSVIIGKIANILLYPIGKFERNGNIMANDNQKVGQIGTASPVADPIGLALQRLHDEVAKEALPDSFLSLLDALDAGTGSNSTTQPPVSGVAT